MTLQAEINGVQVYTDPSVPRGDVRVEAKDEMVVFHDVADMNAAAHALDVVSVTTLYELEAAFKEGNLG